MQVKQYGFVTEYFFEKSEEYLQDCYLLWLLEIFETIWTLSLQILRLMLLKFQFFRLWKSLASTSWCTPPAPRSMESQSTCLSMRTTLLVLVPTHMEGPNTCVRRYSRMSLLLMRLFFLKRAILFASLFKFDYPFVTKPQNSHRQ